MILTSQFIDRASRCLLIAKQVSVAVTCGARRSILLLLAIGACVGCGSNATTTSPVGPSAPVVAQPDTITITAFSVIPLELSTTVGTRVTFVNNDVVAHQLAGGPDPSTPDCPQIDAVGFLAPGQRKQTDAFPTMRTCEYHDHTEEPGHPHSIVNGRIIIR